VPHDYPSRRAPRAPRTLLLTLAVGVIAACTDRGDPLTTGTRTVVDTAAVLSVVVDLTGAVPRLRVTTNAHAHEVVVTYWSDNTGGLRVRAVTIPVASSTAQQILDTAEVALPRTVLGRRYTFVVEAVGETPTVSTSVSGALDTPAAPPELAAITFTASGHPTRPLTLLELHGALYDGFVIVDSAGAPVWQWRTVGAPNGSTRRANGDLVLVDAGSGLVEVTPAGDVVHRLAAHDERFDQDVSPHHDVIATPQNTLLFLSHDARTVGGHVVIGDAIWEWTPETGTLTERWSTFDALDPATDWTAASTSDDWVHANSIALGPRGNVVLSMRFLDQVLSISSDWRRVEWRLGGPGSTLQQTQGTPFFGQHSAQELPNGRVLLFDNGSDGAQGPGVSRLLEVAIDTAAGTSTPVWEYRPASTSFSPIVGTARRLDNGNTFGLFGVSQGFLGATGPVRALEVDAAGRVVWSLVIGGVVYAYRATPLDRLMAEEVVPASGLPRRGGP